MSEDQIEKLANHCSVDSFKKNSAVNFKPGFVRKGQVGDWKNHFTVNQNEVYDQMLKKKLAGSGLSFQYTLSLDSTVTY